MILDFIKNFEWENEPEDISFIDSGVNIIAGAETDFWLDKANNSSKRNAAFFYVPKIGDFEIKAQFEVMDFANFSQCGLMIKINNQNAFKISLMSDSIKKTNIGTSASIMGVSDWAVYPLKKVEKDIFYKIIKKENVFFASFSFDGITYHQVRQFSFVESLIEVQAGAYFASPSKNNYLCKLKNIEIK